MRPFVLATATVVLVGGCRSVMQRGAPGSRILAPASTFDVAAFAPEGRIEWTFYRRGATDTAEQPIGHLETEEGSATNTTLTLITHWSPPFESTDSLVVDRATLAPRQESSRSAPLAFQYRYQTDRVTGTIRKGDSAARPVAITVGERVYAFNELDQLARSLPFRSGTQVVVPFFSEADADIEHDTLAVLGDTLVDGAPARIVRFADPVIVRRYLIEPRTRRVVESDITQRRSGTRFRLVPLRQPTHLEIRKSASADGQYRLVPIRRTTADTTHWSVVQHAGPGAHTTLQVMIAGTRSSASVDSVLFDSQTLLPYWEHLYGRDTVIVAFSNGRATGWRSAKDSAHVAVDVPTPGFVYSSTMDNLVVRSLPLADHYDQILPFWGGDRLELDTVIVRAADDVDGRSNTSNWVVDLREPFAVETLWIDRASRRITRHVYTWRRGGTTSEVVTSPRGD